MENLAESVAVWLEKARFKLTLGGIQAEDLEELAAAVHPSPKVVRQRLLYLHALTPNIRSKVIGMALHEPVPGSITEISPESEWPYNTVFDAILDGWLVVQFPPQVRPFDDREIDILGYEFILQQLEVVDA